MFFIFYNRSINHRKYKEHIMANMNEYRTHLYNAVESEVDLNLGMQNVSIYFTIKYNVIIKP